VEGAFGASGVVEDVGFVMLRRAVWQQYMSELRHLKEQLHKAESEWGNFHITMTWHAHMRTSIS
jgi:hypothetical protein